MGGLNLVNEREPEGTAAVGPRFSDSRSFHRAFAAPRSASPLLLLLLLACLGSVNFINAAVPNPLPVVRLRAESIAHQDRIVLGDLGEIVASDAATAEQLRSIALGYAPEVGALREIPRDRIALAIAAAGFVTGTVEIQTPASVLIRRAAQIVAPSLIQEAVERATLPALRAKGAEAQLVRLDLTRIEVRTGAVEVRAATTGVKNPFAPFTVFLEVWIDQRLARRFSTTAQIEASAAVLVAAHDIAEKTRVLPGDFVLEVKKLERDTATYLNDPQQLRGVSLVRALTRGEAITGNALTADIVVKLGDAVRITGESGGVKIQVAGEARAAGHVGDRIQVKNLQSGTFLQAIIVDEGLVSVRF